MANDKLSIKTVCQLTGINSHTLRAWERRYSLVQPDRLDNGRRFYSRADLEKLKLVSILLRKGFAVSQLADCSLVRLSELANETSPTPDQREDSAQRRTSELGQKLEQAIAHYELRRLSPLLAQARAEYGLRDYIFQLVLPLLQRVGAAVDCSSMSVGQEHALSAVVRYHLMQNLFVLTEAQSHIHGPLATKSFVLATMEGNQHELGTIMAAVLCAYHGFPLFYLGAQMPARGLSEACQALGANVIILGLTPTLARQADIDAYLAELFRTLPEVCEVWVGGCPYFKPSSDERLYHLGDLKELDELLAHLQRAE